MKSKVVLLLSAGLFLVPRLPAATSTVVTIEDSGPGSLQQAILDANATEEPDLIQFNIPGAGVQTIAPLTPLPVIDFPVVIDGYSQPGASPNTLSTGNNATLLIELDGQNVGAEAHGLALRASDCMVRGLIINRFSLQGIYVISHRNVIAGNFFGVDATGTLNRGNAQSGIFLVLASNNLIGGTTPADRNVISANGDNGISIYDAPGTANRVLGNYIGVNAAGTAALGNAVFGIRIQWSGGNFVGRRYAGLRQSDFGQCLCGHRRSSQRGQRNPGQLHRYPMLPEVALFRTEPALASNSPPARGSEALSLGRAI